MLSQYRFLEEDGFKIVTMKRTTRGEQILNRLVNDPRCELSVEGKNWLIQVLDPNHDRPFVKTGWPSQNTRPSLIRQVKQSISVSATSGGGAPVSAPWDLHVAWLPVLNILNYSPTVSRTNGEGVLDMSSGAQTDQMGGLMLRAQFNSGADVSWTSIPGTANNLGTLGVDPVYLAGDTRLVGVGFEITDTSAEINKQGSLAVYSYPQMLKTEAFHMWVANPPASTLATYQGNCVRVILPPTNLKSALLLPDTQIWEAKYGSYQVPTFSDLNNPACDNSTVVHV